MNGRAIAGLALGALGLYFLWSVFFPGGDGDDEPLAFTSSNQCAECHRQVYEEWRDSQHSISFTNPRVLALSKDFQNKDCIDCHAPKPVFVTGIGERVLPRSIRQHEGVDCIACHILPDGRMAGTAPASGAPCRPVVTADLQRAQFCAGCHNQHKTVDQWRESDWPEKGEDCLSCHMPHRDGDPTKGRDHRFPGGDLHSMRQRAVELSGRPGAAGSWIVELENVGAGHSFPTDERSRAADLFYRAVGSGPWRHLYRIRDPYRHETDLPSTLLHAHQTLTLTIEDEPGPVEVALFYKRDPYWKDPTAPDPDGEAELVHRIVLAP